MLTLFDHVQFLTIEGALAPSFFLITPSFYKRRIISYDQWLKFFLESN